MSVATLKRTRARIKSRRIKSAVDTGLTWNRPIDWPQLPDVAVGDQKFVGLIAVFDHDSNYIAFSFTLGAGQYHVDWGDGTSGNFASGGAAAHQYTYSDAALGAVTSEGFKTAIVTVTPVTGGATFSAISLALKHSSLGANNTFATGWLDIKMSAPSITGGAANMVISGGGTAVQHRYLRQFEFVGTTGLTGGGSMFANMSSLESVKLPKAFTSLMTGVSLMFSGCSALRKVPLLDTSASTTFTSMFSGCSRLKKVPLYDTSAGTVFTSMFQGCQALEEVPAFNTSAGTTFTSMFSGCSALETIPLFDTHLATNMATMFQSCTNLRSIPALDTSSNQTFGSMFQNCVRLRTIPLLNTTAGTIFSSMFSGCTSLEIVPALDLSNGTIGNLGMFGSCTSLSKSLVTGAKYSHIYPGQMSAAELDRVYTNLGTAAASQTITVTGNQGIAGDTPSIATAKGWTVTGS